MQHIFIKMFFLLVFFCVCNKTSLYICMSFYLYPREDLHFHILPRNLHTLQQAGRRWLNLCKNWWRCPYCRGNTRAFPQASVRRANMQASISRVIECISVCITRCCVADPCTSTSALNVEWLLNILCPTPDIPLIS